MGGRYAVIDTETTGLSPAYGHALCEIGIIVCEGETVLENYEQLIHPGRTIPPGVSAIHGITNEMVAFAPRFFQIKDEILKRMEGAVLVFHNAPFDLGFLAAALRGCGARLPAGPVLDTVLLTRKLYPGISHSLPNLTARFGIAHETQHRALADTEAARLLFLQCARAIAGENWTLEDLLAYQGPLTRFASASSPAVSLPEDFLATLAEQRSVEILYQTAQGQPHWRRIDPYSVRYSRHTAYIEAFCHLRSDLRQFRWDRVREYRVTNEKQEPK